MRISLMEIHYLLGKVGSLLVIKRLVALTYGGAHLSFAICLCKFASLPIKL